MTQDSDKEEFSGGGLPLRRLQLAFNGIIDNSIPFNLSAIQRHKQLIEEVFNRFICLLFYLINKLMTFLSKVSSKPKMGSINERTDKWFAKRSKT